MIIENKYVTVVSGEEYHLNEYFKSARIETLQTMEVANNLSEITTAPVLPETREWLEENKIYDYNGEFIQVITSHYRTEHNPHDLPDLFSFFRTDTGNLRWISNEKVDMGWKRWYNEIEYQVIQPHMTVEGLTPDLTPALWGKVPADIVDWYQPTGAHDAFRIDTLMRYTDGNVYKSLIDYNVYSPIVLPSGWSLQPDL